MRRFPFSWPLVLTALAGGILVGTIAGCSPAGRSATPPGASPGEEGIDAEITHAQPRLPTLKIFLGAESLNAELALTPRQEQVGVMFRTNIQDSDAMLFDLGTPQQASFWMKNCPESISAAYITPDGIIQELHHFEHDDTNPVVSLRGDIRFVLETQDGWFQHHNIGVGTIIESDHGPLARVLRRQ